MKSFIYYTDISDILNNQKDFNDLLSKTNILEKLSDERIEKISKIENRKLKIQSIYSYLLLHHAFSEFGIDINKLDMQYNEYGKPYFKDNYYFNISHSYNIVGVAISDYEIGLDIQFIKILLERERLNRLALSVFTEEEYTIFSGLTIIEKNDYFSRKWVQKESYLKFMGTGVFKIDKLTIPDEKNFFIDKINDKYGLSYYLAAIGIINNDVKHKSDIAYNKNFVLKKVIL